MNETIHAYWQTYLDTLPADHPHRQITPEAWGFGDSPRMADELGALVRAGIKAATASLIWEYEFDGESIPKVGDVSIILGGQDQPLCIIEATETFQLPFDHVPPSFAYDEGEGDRSLAYWRSAHWAFFLRSCQRIGCTPSMQMPILCERFRLIYT